MILDLDTNIFNHGLSRHNILAFSQGFPIGLPCRNWIEVGLDAPSAAPFARARRRKLSPRFQDPFFRFLSSCKARSVLKAW